MENAIHMAAPQAPVDGDTMPEPKTNGGSLHESAILDGTQAQPQPAGGGDEDHPIM